MKIKLKKRKYESPYKNIIKELHKKEIREDDYFKNRKICLLGARKPIQSYGGNVPEEQLIGWNINPYEHTNLGIIGASGIGKTRLIKPIIAQYHKQGYKVLVFSPKEDEWSSAKLKGQGRRLHQNVKNESLPIVSYCPSYVRNYLERNNFPLDKYKFYSHSIKHFTSREVWESLGFSSTASSFAVGLVNQGVTKLKDLQKKMKYSSLLPVSKNSADNKIETMIGTKFINDRLGEIDIEYEWAQNNIIAINYYSQKGFLMSTDVWLLIDKVREYCQRQRRKGSFQPVLILFDDANYYAETKPYNNYSISSIIDCQINYRSLGVNVIVSYQFPEVVNSDVVKGSSSRLISFVEDPNSLRGIMPEDAIYVLKVGPEDGGLLIDDKTYTVEWVYRPKGRDWYRFFPFDCNVGHD